MKREWKALLCLVIVIALFPGGSRAAASIMPTEAPKIVYAEVTNLGYAIVLTADQEVQGINSNSFWTSKGTISTVTVDEADPRNIWLQLTEPLGLNETVNITVYSGAFQNVSYTANEAVSNFKAVTAMEKLALKSSLDTNHDGVHIDDIAAYVNTTSLPNLVGTADDRLEFPYLLGLIDPRQSSGVSLGENMLSLVILCTSFEFMEAASGSGALGDLTAAKAACQTLVESLDSEENLEPAALISLMAAIFQGGVAIQQYGTALGWIKNSYDEPLSGVTVAVYRSAETTPVVTITTGVEGLYHVLLPPGSYDIVFEKEGYIPVTETVQVRKLDMTQMNITLDTAV